MEMVLIDVGKRGASSPANSLYELQFTCRVYSYKNIAENAGAVLLDTG